MAYLLTDALAPHFREEMLLDVKNLSYYSIIFDETTNVEDKKELLITVRHWSETKEKVLCRHLQTFFVGKADASMRYSKIQQAISNAQLPLQNLLLC